MDVLGLDPLRVGALIWQPAPGRFSLTVVCKATYRLQPGESALAAEPEPIHLEDAPWGGDAAQSLYAPGDLVPLKARADVMLVGHAFAPRGEPVRALVARLVVGPVDKEIEICAERRWTREGQLREEGRFSSMPLRYERAAGGPGTANPAGVRTGLAALADAHGAVLLPNLQPAGGTPEGRRDAVDPAGFGPIPAEWPARRARLGHHAAEWSDAHALEGPLPDDLDYAYFNAAPPDQQVPLLRDGERLILQHLHRDHERLITSLPAARPRAFAEREGGPPHEVGLRCDALWIDTDRAICTLTWRGQIALTTRDEGGRVLVALESPGQRLGYEELLDLLGPPEPPTLPPLALPPSVIAPPPPVIAPPPVLEPPPDEAPAAASPFALSTARVPIFQPPPDVLPFAREAGPSPLAQPREAPTRPRTDTVMAIRGAKVPAQGPSWLQKPSASPTSAPPPPATPRFGEPPPMRMPPPAPLSPAIPERHDDRPSFPPLQRRESAPPPPHVPASAEVPSPRGRARNFTAVTAVLEAPAPRPGDVSPAVREALDLIWVDPALPPRLHASFPDVLAGVVPHAESDPDAWVVRVLTLGRHCDAAGIEHAMAEAVDHDGRFRPPLVVAAGVLRFSFDELETLRATVSAALPFASGDPILREALDAAAEVLTPPWPGPPSGLTDRLAQRVFEAFAQGARALSPGYLDAQVERLLLERRAYQRRAVLGGDCIRALLTLPGGEAPCPVYMPDMLAKTLPMFHALEARLLVEAHAPQDQTEAHPVALRALALGRVITAGRWRVR